MLDKIERYLNNILIEKNNKIIPENIKAGVNILGVTGAYGGGISYTPLTYIESTGTQYIDTGIIPSTATRIVLDVAFNDINSTNRNGWASSANREKNIFFFGTHVTLENFYATASYKDWVDTYLAVKDTERHIFDISNTALKLDEITYGTGSMRDTAEEEGTLYIFALHTEYANDGNIYYQGTKEKVYFCKIYDGETLVRDFIPVKTKDDVICLYDKVTDKFYYNGGTGDFIAGGVA